jgi:hypothetical protein
MKFSKFLIKRSTQFLLILLSDVENELKPVPERNENYETQASIKTIHHANNRKTLMQHLVHETIIHASRKLLAHHSKMNVY